MQFLQLKSVQAQSPLLSTHISPTYSIIAQDPKTGEIAVASLSFSSSTYKTFMWGNTPIGVFILHSPATHSFQVWDTQLWSKAQKSSELLTILTSKDAYKEYYQVACIDWNGQFAFFNGKNNLAQTSTSIGSNYYILASFAPDSSTLNRMKQVFETLVEQSLAERMLASLAAALPEHLSTTEKQSATLLVFTNTLSALAPKGRLIDLQVNNQPNALKDLDIKMRRQLSYLYLRKGDQAANEGNLKNALLEYRKAAALFPDDLETQYWYGITLADHHLIEEACIVLAEVFHKNNKWRERTARLPDDGLLHISKRDFERILSLP